MDNLSKAVFLWDEGGRHDLLTKSQCAKHCSKGEFALGDSDMEILCRQNFFLSSGVNSNIDDHSIQFSLFSGMLRHPFVTRGDHRCRLDVNWWTWIKFRKKQKNENFSSITFTTVSKICLYGRHFDSSVYPHGIFYWHLADSPKLLKNGLIAENLNEVRSSSLTKSFFKSLGELAKCT